MKFTKTVAEALANKTIRELRTIRSEQIKEFKPTKEQEKKIKELIQTCIEAQSALIQAKETLNEFIKSDISICRLDSKEDLFNKCLGALAYNSTIKIPSYSELTDEFLVESIDAINAEELISKVMSKYSKL